VEGYLLAQPQEGIMDMGSNQQEDAMVVYLHKPRQATVTVSLYLVMEALQLPLLLNRIVILSGKLAGDRCVEPFACETLC
jgi:hypothetical protein